MALGFYVNLSLPEKSALSSPSISKTQGVLLCAFVAMEC
jgi:hypothetical protein